MEMMGDTISSVLFSVAWKASTSVHPRRDAREPQKGASLLHLMGQVVDLLV